MSIFRFTLSAMLIAFTLGAGPLSTTVADEGQPVAVRLWPGKGVTIETMWNFNVAIRIDDSNRKHLQRPADIELHHQAVESDANSQVIRQQVWTANGPQAYALDRKPNESEFQWGELTEDADLSPNALTVTKISLGEGSKSCLSLISVDGVRILDNNGISEKAMVEAMAADPELSKQLMGVDVYLPSHTKEGYKSLGAFVEMAKPKNVLMPADPNLEVDFSDATHVAHNTMAVSMGSDSDQAQSTRWVALQTTPWEMTEELSELFTKKEAACKQSREFFATLSVKQMNFEPSNGTHTPRWNTEHMMARELLYFSQFYHGADTSVPVMNINPRQMPPDYRMAHPDWSGEEESRQTLRVQEFTRRFAYLLEGMDLDRRPKGSQWTPRALLRQMFRHYSEHTDNVRKKMELPEWPDE